MSNNFPVTIPVPTVVSSTLVSNENQNQNENENKRKKDLVEYAYVAYAFGFVPIPLRDKIPVIKGWPDLRNNPAEDQRDISMGLLPKNVRRIKDLIEANQANNIGIVTGEASNVVVLDLDFPEGVNIWYRWLQIYGEIPDTFTVKTGSGGLHIYFRYTPQTAMLRNLNRIQKSPIDFRTNGGQIIFPGSINTKTGQPYLVQSGYDGQYPTIAEMPNWLFQILLADQQSKPRR